MYQKLINWVKSFTTKPKKLLDNAYISGWDVTNKDWATGFDIKIELPDELWFLHIDGVRKEPLKLFTPEDRAKMRKLREEILEKLQN